MSVQSMKDSLKEKVVAVDTADDLGKVKHYVVATSGVQILRLHIDGRRGGAQFVDWDDLSSFGDDRVVVTSADAVHESDDERDTDTAKGDLNILGSRVLSTAGHELGEVKDVEFDGGTGTVMAAILKSGTRIEAASIRSLGRYALVVNA